MYKKLLLYIILFISGYSVRSQNTADYYLGMGEKMLTSKKPYAIDSGLYYFYYVLDNFPTFRQECSRSMIRIAGALEKDSIMQSIQWYKRIINSSSVNDKDKGMEVMETYANYRHNSCLRLATLYNRKKNYEEALQWLYNAQYIYKYETDIATAYENKMVSIASIKFESFKNLDLQDSAAYALIHKLLETDVKYYLPGMDESKTNKVDHYSKLTKTAIKFIDQTYGKEDFRLVFNKAISKIKVKKDKSRKEEKLYYASFKIYNIEYQIHSSIPKRKKADFINDIKQTQFYISLQE